MTHIRRIATILFILGVALMLAGRTTIAQGFWASKPFNQWTDDETRKLLTDSPWAKVVELPQSGGPDSTTFIPLTVIWDSALPVKQAAIRAKMGAPGDVPADAKQVLEQVEEGYRIRIAGVPASSLPAVQANIQSTTESVLKVGKREIKVKGFAVAPAIPTPAPKPSGDAPAAAGGRGGGRGGRGAGGGQDFILSFPTTDLIKVEEADNVELNAKLGGAQIKKSFKLKDMVVGGKLAL